VSAVLASPADSGRSALDKVRALQHTLYRAAKADPGRRFHALMDKVSRRDVLWRAWVTVRLNDGAPGVDRITLDQVEQYGITRLFDELAAELREGRYRPLPARRVFIVPCSAVIRSFVPSTMPTRPTGDELLVGRSA
jgi:RNA-directed DNA polymerase